MGKTKDNLQAAFAGESQARNMYGFFAKAARQEGFGYIAKLFEETAENEMRHAKDEYKLLHGLGNTADCLRKAIEGEDYEASVMYPQFAEEAEAEGNKEAAVLFRTIARVEAEHRDRYKRLLEMVENGTVFKREKAIRWKCGVCGYVHTGKEPPKNCPCCRHSREHFEPANLDE